MELAPSMTKLAKIIPIYKVKDKKNIIKLSTDISFTGYF